MRLIVTTMKDEGPFLLEWAAHHLSIGFDHFIINTNDCSDGTDRIAMRLQELGLATHIDNPGPWPNGPQGAAYDRAMAHPTFAEAEWILVSDADEFLNIHVGDGTLDALFAEVPEANAISFNWLLFGHNGIIEFEDRLVTEQFTRAADPYQQSPVVCRAIKTLHRLDAPFQSISTHRPKLPEPDWQGRLHWVDGDGDRMTRAFAHFGWHSSNVGVGFGNRLGRMHHYAIKSMNAYLMKRLRGDVRTGVYHKKLEETGINYWKLHCWNTVEVDSMRAHRPRLRERLSALLADPELQTLHHDAVAYHLSKIAALSETEAAAEFRNRFKEYIGGLGRCADHNSLTCADLSLDLPRFDREAYPEMLKSARQASVRTTLMHGRLPWFANADALGVDFSKGRRRPADPPARLLPIEAEFVARARREPVPMRPARRAHQCSVLQQIGRSGRQWVLINSANPELIEDILSINSPSTLFVMNPWGYRPEVHTIDRRNRTPDPKLVAQDVAFLEFVDRFSAEIESGVLKVHRCDPTFTLKTFAPGSFDVAYISGRAGRERSSLLFERVMGRLADGGLFVTDTYHRRGKHGDAPLAALNGLLSTHAARLRIHMLEGSHCAIKLLAPVGPSAM